ncbi:MAG: hypothetical protein EHM23_09815 [Acidobacteria bacterium]|nr:MAG: hypothetical protein EHM23_09815 [Acidobacteriota bacterium]
MFPVGISISLTGKYREQGENALNGLRLWEDYVNSTGGLALGNTAGREAITLRYLDDESKVEQCPKNIERLIRDGIQLLFGPYSSGLTGAAAAAAAAEGKILWNHGGACESAYSAHASSVISVLSPARTYLWNLPDLIAHRKLPVNKLVVLVASQRKFPSEVASGLADSCRRHGLEICQVEISRRKFEPIQLIQTALDQDPGCLVTIGQYDEEIKVFEHRAVFHKIDLAVCVAAGVSAFYRDLSRMAEGIVGPSQWEPGSCLRPDLGPDDGWFCQQYYRHFRKTPDYTAGQAFACGLIMQKCLGAASDPAARALRAAALRLDCQTFYGRFHLDPSGAQSGHQPLLVQWESGRKHVVWPPDREKSPGGNQQRNF